MIVEYINYDVLERNDWSAQDDNLFEKASDMDLSEEDYGIFEVEDEQSILDAAEEDGKDWPYGCRHGMCASCSSILYEGEIDISGQGVLSEEQIDDGARVTCIGTPETDKVQLIYNAQQAI